MRLLSSTYKTFLFLAMSNFRVAIFGSNLIDVSFIFSLSFFFYFFKLDYFGGMSIFSDFYLWQVHVVMSQFQVWVKDDESRAVLNKWIVLSMSHMVGGFLLL